MNQIIETLRVSGERRRDILVDLAVDQTKENILANVSVVKKAMGKKNPSTLLLINREWCARHMHIERKLGDSTSAQGIQDENLHTEISLADRRVCTETRWGKP